MAANDHGHVNNLDETQMETLKRYWIALINAISTQSSLPVDQIISSVYGDEFFHAIGYENPDVFTLRWLRACWSSDQLCICQGSHKWSISS
ncbi:unnamed protein product [Rotaria sordida]|uniref:Uncharacterized protein n=1 Tax=Rotaria sordida TaxID=392033 RepID=A0A813SA36_9BILA|nr:unnamed protein product [Rotaria sordida]